MNAWEAFIVGSNRIPCAECMGTGRFHHFGQTRIDLTCKYCNDVGWVAHDAKLDAGGGSYNTHRWIWDNRRVIIAEWGRYPHDGSCACGVEHRLYLGGGG